jgi:hypothetical protein
MGETVAVRDAMDATEQWFVRRGMPHAIPDYSAREDVWTRAWPFLLFVLFLELFATFGDRFAGLAQLGVFLAGLMVLAGSFALVNLLRRRKITRLPDDIGFPELSVFCVAPTLLPLLFSDRGWRGAVTVAVINVVLLGLAFIVTSYGLVPALRVGFVQAIEQIRTVTQLVARGLPLLLLITAFVFLNAEMWQVAHDFPPMYFAITVGFMVLLALSFLALRVPQEVDLLAHFASWEDCCRIVRATDAPVGDAMSGLEGPLPEPDLSRVEVLNVSMLLTISQAVQTLLVGATAGLFYVGFGLLAVRSDTILQWTTATELDPIATLSFLGDDVVLTWEHLAVAGFVAAFSVLQFAVSSVTDDNYRAEFYDDIVADAREVLAVRAVVRAVHPATTE